MLAALLLVVASVALWRRWGWPAVAAVWGGAVAVVSTVAAMVRRRPRAPSTPPDVHRVRGAVDEARRAERAREAAVRIEADVDAAGDAEALVEHLTRRSRGES